MSLSPHGGAPKHSCCFREPITGELQRIFLPHTRVNKGYLPRRMRDPLFVHGRVQLAQDDPSADRGKVPKAPEHGAHAASPTFCSWLTGVESRISQVRSPCGSLATRLLLAASASPGGRRSRDGFCGLSSFSS